MNAAFSATFPVVFLFFVFLDRSALKLQSSRARWLYYGISLAVIVMYTAKLLRWNPPMPIRFFVTYVSPKVEWILGLK